MRVRFNTLDDKYYFIQLEKYEARRDRKTASDFQFSWKQFFTHSFPRDYWCEEFLIRPFLTDRFRLDLFNFSRRFAVECHGDQHVSVSKHFHGDSQEKFLNSIVRDREKELWCERNNVELITVYTSTPRSADHFKQKYPHIWK